MTTQDNLRGYAFAALRNAHAKQLAWQWGAAAAKEGYYPNFYEYSEEALTMWDKMMTTAPQDITTAKATIDIIIDEMGKSIRETYRGNMHYPTDDEGKQYMTAHHDVVLDQPLGYGDDGEELTLGSSFTEPTDSYAAVDDADVMRTRLRLIASHIRESDMELLVQYVSGEHNSINAMFENPVDAALFRKRVRRACAKLEGLELFA